MLIELTDDMFKYHVMNYELGIQLDHPSKELYEQMKAQILSNQKTIIDLSKAVDERIKELQIRVDNWSNHSQAGTSAYSVVVRELEVYEAIKQILDNTIVQPSGEKS